MIDDLDAAEIHAVFARGVANGPFIAKQRNAGDTLAGTLCGGYDRTRIVTLGKNDVLWSGTCALANSFENVHVCAIFHSSFSSSHLFELTNDKREIANGK